MENTANPTVVLIRNNLTGVSRTYESAVRSDDFIWEEGNYSCDCNRAIFFAEAVNEPDPDVPCGEGAFSVRVTVDGVVIYDELQKKMPSASG